MPVEDSEIEVALRNGARVTIRPIRADDVAGLQRFHTRLSERSVYQRHFRALPHLSDEQAAYFCSVDGYDRFALVALDPDDPAEIIAVVRYDREDGADAEYAALVTDAWQGLGLGSAMTRRLIQAAIARDVRTFFALVLPGNQGMLQVLHDLGLPERRRYEDGAERVVIQIAPTAAPDAAADQ
jgi:GNAT superfamily N-acetyltransferase